METFQAVVLSGGGSKGPYGLGVLLALEKYQKEHKKKDHSHLLRHVGWRLERDFGGTR